MLAAPVLAFGDDAGGQVGDAHRRVGFVDVLAARAAGAEGVDAQLRRVDLNGLRFVRLGQHRHGASAGVDAALGFGGGHTLHPVATRLELQCPINASAFNANHHLFVAAQFTGRLADHLDAPLLAGAIAGVQAQQITGEQRGFVAARASADFQKRVACVVWVFGQQHALQLRFQRGHACAAVRQFLLRHGLHRRVGVLQHGLGGFKVGAVLQPFLIRRDQGHHLGMLARQHHELGHVLHDVFAGQQKIQLGQALHRALKLSAHERFHRGSLS